MSQWNFRGMLGFPVVSSERVARRFYDPLCCPQCHFKSFSTFVKSFYFIVFIKTTKLNTKSGYCGKAQFKNQSTKPCTHYQLMYVFTSKSMITLTFSLWPHWSSMKPMWLWAADVFAQFSVQWFVMASWEMCGVSVWLPVCSLFLDLC